MVRLGAGVVLGSGFAAVMQVSAFVVTPVALTTNLAELGSMTSATSTANRRAGVLCMAEDQAGDSWGSPPPTSSAPSPKSGSGDDWDDLLSEVEARDSMSAAEASAAAPSVASQGTGAAVEASAPAVPSAGAGEARVTMTKDGRDNFPEGPVQLNPIIDMDYDNIPGKIKVDDETLARQQKGLEKIAQQLRRERLDREAEEAIVFGFCPNAELANSRAAMFGITVGMLTEYWTGQSIPQQVETMLQVLGVLPLDYESMFG